jgi:hypothetical protein
MLKFQLVREIPQHYILDRWKKDFRQLHVKRRPPSDLVPNNRMDRYDYISMRCLQLVDSAVLSDKYRLALRLVRETEKFLLNSNTHDDTQPRIKSRVPKVNKPNTVTGQTVVGAATGNRNDGLKGPEVLVRPIINLIYTCLLVSFVEIRIDSPYDLLKWVVLQYAGSSSHASTANPKGKIALSIS